MEAIEPVIKKRGPGGARFGVQNGMYGKHHTKEHKQNLREQMLVNNPFKGKHHTPETRALLSALRKGKPGPRKGCKLTDETKQRISAAKKGKETTEETKEKLRISRRRNPSSGAKGKKWTEETKEKMRVASVQIWIDKTPEQRKDLAEKISKALKVRIFTQEWKDKLREARKNFLLNIDIFSYNQFLVGEYFSKKNNKKIPYQSSYEKKAFEILEDISDIIKFDRCPYAVPYFLEDGKHNYIPDILITFSDGALIVIEVKPIFMLEDPINLVKFAAAKDYFDKLNISFDIWTEIELGLASPTPFKQ